MSFEERSILEDYVLVLNKNWSPLDTTTVKGAFIAICCERVRFVNTEDYSIHDFSTWAELPVAEGMPCVTTYSARIRAPEVIVLNFHAHVKRKEVAPFSRRNLCRRDQMTCQYCGGKPQDRKNLTIDHILPKGEGGKTSWVNCVLSCFKCNSYKANRTPDEAGLKLRVRPELRLKHPNDPAMWNRPYEPRWTPVFRVAVASLKPSWSGFLTNK